MVHEENNGVFHRNGSAAESRTGSPRNYCKTLKVGEFDDLRDVVIAPRDENCVRQMLQKRRPVVGIGDLILRRIQIIVFADYGL